MKKKSLLLLCLGLGVSLLPTAAARITSLTSFPEVLSPWLWVGWSLCAAGLVTLFPWHCSSLKTEDSWLIDALILFVTALSLSMLIRSGYYWDDAVNATQYLSEKYNGASLWRNVLHFMRLYVELGRINVLSFYYYFFFYIENVSIYKALTILLVLANQLILRLTLREMGLSKRAARLGMLLLPLMIQLRAYQDPVSGFYGLMQVLTAEMLLTVCFLLRWLRTNQARWMWFSLTAFVIGLLTYEVCFPFILLVFLLIWNERKNFFRALKSALPFITGVVLMLAAVVFVRIRYAAESTYAGVAFSMDLGAILRTAYYQITAALPLSFYTAKHELAIMGRIYPANAVMAYDFVGFLKAIRALDILLVLLSLWLLRHFCRTDQESRDDCNLWVSGLCFWLLPTVTVAMSQRYQGQLFAGLGYLPVYMQYFGVIMLLIAVLRRVPRTVLRDCLFVVVFLLNLQNNRAVTEVMNRDFYYPREAAVAALRGGILDFLPEGATLIADNDEIYIWESNWNGIGLYSFYDVFSKKDPTRAGGVQMLREFLTDGTMDDLYLISYSGNADRGLTRLGRVRSIEMDAPNRQIVSVQTDKVLFFISGTYPEQNAVRLTDAMGHSRKIDSYTGQRVRANRYGILYKLDEDEVIDYDSLLFDDYLR